ncbi:MAG: hypothetical protein JNM19_11880 [Chitinophagaceae bacterium]|nr:hypothetical protein [Chitinophagaceae bacterium]
MNDEFHIPVSFGGKEYHFPARLLNYGYTIKLEVVIDGNTILFEPDEERNWRALVPFDEITSTQKTNPELLRAVAEAIEEITK